MGNDLNVFQLVQEQMLAPLGCHPIGTGRNDQAFVPGPDALIDPTLKINTPANVWLKIARKEMNGAMALMTGKYKASGKITLLMKMDKIFSRQPTQEEISSKGWLK